MQAFFSTMVSVGVPLVFCRVKHELALDVVSSAHRFIAFLAGEREP